MIDRLSSSGYFLSVVIRIIWTIIVTQQGYIHPDEFFQGPQIVFDDFFHQNFTRTHEFQGSSPLRSVAILYLLYGFPLLILRSLSTFFDVSIIPFDWKLIFPRLTIVCLSFGTDLLFFRLIKSFYPKIETKQHRILMSFYGLAHVTLVFFTRTLSNSIEAFLFLTLISAVHSNLLSILSQSNEQPKRDGSYIFTSIAIGTICSLGIFNRPTFPIFALVPILYWLTTLIRSIEYSSRVFLFVIRISTLIFITFLFVSFILIRFDSVYYQQNWVICPWNFFRYNVDRDKLVEHGLHPPWLHFCVNASILYGPLHWCAVFWLISRLNFRRNFFSNDQRRWIPDFSISTLFALLYFVPFIPLSLIPHQEARFLLPLIFPLILLIIPILIKHQLDRSIFIVWCLFNVLLTVLYGHLHQGGLIPALRYFHQSSISSKTLLITHHTYMPPDYLVRPFGNEQMNETLLIDLQGASPEKLQLTIEHYFQTNVNHSIQLFVLLPFSRRSDLNVIQSKELRKQFLFHLDLDHPINSFLLDHFKLELYRIDGNA